MIKALHLDNPITTRFVRFFGELLQGDFGISYRSHEPVAKLIAERMPATVELALASLFITLIVAVPSRRCIAACIPAPSSPGRSCSDRSPA